jgi:hypothetical protein
MDLGPEHLCDHQSCGRSFPTAAALNFHKRSCPAGKKRLQDALSKAKGVWDRKKKARTAAMETRQQEAQNLNEIPPTQSTPELQVWTSL